MNIKLLCIGKTDDANLKALIAAYSKRLNRYVSFSIEIIPDIKQAKSLTVALQKEKEGQVLLQKLNTTDHLILLDERGTVMPSMQFAQWLQKKMNSGLKTLVFVIGGPYGFSDAVYARAQQKVSLSAMTFSHQMVRLFAVEQLYRGYAILKGDPYHHK